MGEMDTRRNPEEELSPVGVVDVDPTEANVGSGDVNVDDERRRLRGAAVQVPDPTPDPAVLGPNQPTAAPDQSAQPASQPSAQVTVNTNANVDVQADPQRQAAQPRQLTEDQRFRLQQLEQQENSFFGGMMKWFMGEDYFQKQRLEILLGAEKAREVMAAIEKAADGRARADAVMGGTRDPNIEKILSDLEKDGALAPDVREQLTGAVSAIDKRVYDARHASVSRELEYAELMYGQSSFVGRWMGDYGKQQLAETRIRLLVGDPEKAQQMIESARDGASNRARADFDAGRMSSDPDLAASLEGLDPEVAAALTTELKTIDKVAYDSAMNKVVREKLGDEIAKIREEAEKLGLDEAVNPEQRDQKIREALARLKEKNPNLTDEQLQVMEKELKSEHSSAYSSSQDRQREAKAEAERAAAAQQEEESGGFWGSVGSFFSSAAAVVTAPARLAYDALVPDSVKEVISDVVEVATDVVTTVGSAVGSAASWLGEVTGITDMATGLYEMGAGLVTMDWDRMSNGAQQFAKGATTHFNNLVSAVQAVGGFLYDVGESLGINDICRGVGNVVMGAVTGDWERIGKGFTQIGSGAVRLVWECTGLADAWRAVSCLGQFAWKLATTGECDTALLIEGAISLGAAALSIGSIVATGGAAVAVVGGLRAVGTQMVKKLATEGFKQLGKELGEKIVTKAASVLGKEVVEKASKEAGLQAGREFAEKFGKEAAEYCAKHGLKELPQEVAKEMGERIAKEQAQTVAREATEKMLKEAGVDKIIKDQVVEALENVSKGKLDDLIKKGLIDKQTAKAMQKALNKELCDDALKEALTKEITDKLTKDIIEKGEKAFMEGFMESVEKSGNKFVQDAMKDKVVREAIEKGAKEGYEKGVREGVENVVKKAVDDAFKEHRKKRRDWDMGDTITDDMKMMFFGAGGATAGMGLTDLVDRNLMKGNEGPEIQLRKTEDDRDEDPASETVSVEERRKDKQKSDQEEGAVRE